MEEHFRKVLKNHRVDWQKEELLPNLRERLSQKKSKFDLRWLFLLALLFIATCWQSTESGFFIDEKNKNLESVENKQNIALNQDETNTSSNSFLDNVEKNKSAKTDLSHSSDTIESKTENAKIALNSNSSKNNAPLFSNKKEIIIENKLSQKENLKIKNQQANNTTIFAETNLSEKNDNVNSVGQEKEELVEPVPYLKTIAISSDKKPSSISTGEKLNLFEPNFKNDNDKLKESFFISASREAGFVNRTTNFQGDDAELVMQLEANEATVNSFALLNSSVLIGYQHQSGWMLQSGLEQNVIREFFKHISFKTKTIYDLNEKASYFVNQNVDTIFISDTTAILISEVRKVRHSNKLTWFNIPLEVGYHHTIGKANIYGTLGVNYAFAPKYKGRVNQINEDGSDSIIDNPDFKFKNRIGIQLGLGVEYPLFNRTLGFVRVAYRQSPKLIGDNSKEQFYQSFPAAIGFRIPIR